jgi:transcriptional regulator with XRE-family HTH domain
MERLEISRAAVAAACQVSVRTVDNWRAGNEVSDLPDETQMPQLAALLQTDREHLMGERISRAAIVRESLGITENDRVRAECELQEAKEDLQRAVNRINHAEHLLKLSVSYDATGTEHSAALALVDDAARLTELAPGVERPSGSGGEPRRGGGDKAIGEREKKERHP